jgi:hypothetical protein
VPKRIYHPERPSYNAWYSGFISALALVSLFQDYCGKEGYIEVVRNHWMSAYITVPLALAALLLSFWLLWYARREEDKL